MRCAPVNRPAVDLSQYFSHFGEREQEAVAAFDFLHEEPSSPDDLQNRIHVKVIKSEQGIKEPGKGELGSNNVKASKSEEPSPKQ